MDDDKKIDSFDDLFEPFDIDPPEDESQAVPPPVATREVQQVPCPSCGTQNPEYNRHCESCGARLGTGPLPVAPPPMVRNTAGSRALGVLAGVILAVALAALIWNVVRDDETAAQTPTETTTTTTESISLQLTQLIPTSVEASSELRGFEAEGLIDNDPETYWNDASLRGRDGSLTFRFSQPVQIVEIEIYNLDDEEKFARNYRVQGYEIIINDLATSVQGLLLDTMEVQTIQIPSVRTTELTFLVKSIHPAQSYDGNPPFDELAIREIRFYGQTVDG